MSEIKPENYTVSPGLAQNLTQVEVNTNTIPPLQTVSGKDYPRYSILAYNVNENGISDINPENYKVSPGLAQNLTYVEVDTSVIPALSGVHGVYPRYAQLVYLLNPSSGGGGTGGGITSINGKTGDSIILSASDIPLETPLSGYGDTVEEVLASLTNVIPQGLTPQNTIYVSKNYESVADGNFIIIHGFKFTKGTDIFDTISQAVTLSGKNIIIDEGTYEEDITVNASNISLIGAGNVYIKGKLTFANTSDCSIKNIKVEAETELVDSAGQLTTHAIRLTGTTTNFTVDNVYVKMAGSGSALYAGPVVNLKIINSCLIGGVFNSGKTVGAVQFGKLTDPIIKHNYFGGSVYFNGGLENGTIDSNSIELVDSSAVSFAFILSGIINITNNNIYGNPVNNALKINGTGTISTPTGIDASGLTQFNFISNRVSADSSFFYIQSEAVSLDASKFKFDSNILNLSQNAIIFNDEHDPIKGFALGDGNISSGAVMLKSDHTQTINSNISMGAGYKFLVEDNNSTQYAGLFLGNYTDDNDDPFSQIEIGSASMPLCLNHNVKSGNVEYGKNILVNYRNSEGIVVEDKVAYLSDIQGGSSITIDDTLSLSSTNPVQNKVITEELNTKATNETVDTVVSSLTGARVNQSAKTRFSFTNTSSQVTSAFELYIPKYDWMPGGFFVAAELKSFFSELGGPTYVDQLTYEDWLKKHPEGYDYFTEEHGPYLVTSFYNYGVQTDSTIVIELNVVCLGPYLKNKTPETVFTTEISANTPTNIKLSSTGGLLVDNNTLNNITINLYVVSGNNISTKTIQFIAYNKNNNILISNAIIGDTNSIGDSSFINNLDISSIDNLIELELTSLYDSISYVSIKQTTIKIG